MTVRLIRKAPRTLREILGAEPTAWGESTPKMEAGRKATARALTYALTKPRHIEGYVTRTELAAEYGMQAQLARLYLKRAGVKKPADGWRWKVGSKQLAKAREALVGSRP